MKNLLIFILIIFSFNSFAQEEESAPIPKPIPKQEQSLFAQVIACKNLTYKKIENIQDYLKGDNLFYLLENLKNDHDKCLIKINELQSVASTTEFEEELLAALTYSEKRLIVDKKVLEIFLNPEAKPSEVKIAQDIIGKSRIMRQTENDYWKKLEETIRVLKETGKPKPEESSDWFFWLSILIVGFLMYEVRRRRKLTENKDLDKKSKSARPIYDRINDFVEKINKKADEINKRKENKKDEE